MSTLGTLVAPARPSLADRLIDARSRLRHIEFREPQPSLPVGRVLDSRSQQLLQGRQKLRHRGGSRLSSTVPIEQVIPVLNEEEEERLEQFGGGELLLHLMLCKKVLRPVPFHEPEPTAPIGRVLSPGSRPFLREKQEECRLPLDQPLVPSHPMCLDDVRRTRCHDALPILHHMVLIPPLMV